MKVIAVISFLTASVVVAQPQDSVTHLPGLGQSPVPMILGAQIVAGPPVTGLPYSAQVEMVTTQALADGNQIERRVTAKRYRDALGRERREDVIVGVDGVSLVFIWDPISRTGFTLDPKNHTVQKTGPLPPPPPPNGPSIGVAYLPRPQESERLKARGLDHGAFVSNTVKDSPAERAGIRTGDVVVAVNGLSVRDSGELLSRILDVPAGSVVKLSVDREGRRMDVGVPTRDRSQVFSDQPMYFPTYFEGPSGSPTKREQLGTRSIEGILAEGSRSTSTIPIGQVGNKMPIEVVSESWFSPELKVVILTKHSDPRKGDIIYRLTNIRRAEPPSTLFEIPQGYNVTRTAAPAGMLVK